jgi:hypothetical protein
MPNRQEPETGTDVDADHRPVDVERLGQLVDDGVVPWPGDLSDVEAAQLTAHIRRRRRSSLIRLIARLIAADILRERTEDLPHEKKPI